MDEGYLFELITLNSDEMKRNVPILGDGAAVDAEVGLLKVRTDYLGWTLSSHWLWNS